MPLIEAGKPPLLGQDRPILVYSAYLGCIGMLVAAALKVDLTSYVDTFSTVTLCAFGGCGFFFAIIGCHDQAARRVLLLAGVGHRVLLLPHSRPRGAQGHPPLRCADGDVRDGD
jgi:hypothetical protein